MQNYIFQTEKLKRLTLFGIIALLVLLVTLFVMLQTSYIQTKITQYITRELSGKFKTNIYIKSVNITLFRGFKFHGIIIEDFDRDTMLSIEDLYLLPSGIPAELNDISFKFAEINKMYLNLYEVKKDTLNIDLIIDKLTENGDTSSAADFVMKIKNFKLTESVFAYKEIDTVKNAGMDYEDLYFFDINAELKDVNIFNSRVKSAVKSISFEEKSGLKVKNISTEKNIISPEKILIKDLKIITENSNLQFDSLNLRYPDRYYFSGYKTSLNAQISIKNGSYVSYKDMAITLQDTTKAETKIFISGNLNGYYNNILLKNFSVNIENIISLKTNTQITNLSDFNNLTFDINIEEMKVHMQEFGDFKIPGIPELALNPPEELQKLKTITYKGKAKGSFNNFKTKGVFFGDFGKITLDATANNDSVSFTSVNGKLFGNNINLAGPLQSNDFGMLSFEQNFTFSFLKNKKIKFGTSGIISKMTYKKHIYKDISLLAYVNQKKLDSFNISINQPELEAQMSGNGDFSDEIPVMDVKFDIVRSNLKTLNIKDKTSSLSLSVKGNFRGINIDDFEGNIFLEKPLVYTEDGSVSTIRNFTLTSTGSLKDSVKNKHITLNSDIVDAELKSNGSISISVSSYKRLIKSVFTENADKKIGNTDKKSNFLDFKINVKNPDIITSLFLPDIKMSKQTSILGYYQPFSEKFNISLNSEQLEYKGVVIKDFYVIAYTREGKMFAGVGGSSVKPNKMFYAENINLEGDFNKNSINFNLIWNNFRDSTNYSADISGKIDIGKNIFEKPVYNCFFDSSQLVVNDVLWTFNNSEIKIDSSHISIRNFRIRHKEEEIYLDGNVSEYQGDMLFVRFKKLNIDNFKPLITEDISLSGKLSGFATLADLYSKPLIFTKDSIVNLNINNIKFGNFYMKSFWDDSKNSIRFNAYNLKGKRRFMNDTIYGEYNPETKILNATVDVRSMLLKTLKDYYKDLVEFNNSAYFTGIVNINGNIENPDITGNFKIKRTTAYIKYLNTFNIFNELNFSFDKKNIQIEKTKVKSADGNGEIYLSGSIRHNNFSDFALNIDMSANNYKILDIIPTDSSYYYGTAFASGSINISGPLNDIFLDANLSTDKNTEIFIPVTSDKTYNEENSFLSFITDTSLYVGNSQVNTPVSDISGFSMNMKLDITPEAEIQILPDESSGEIYTRGNGGLNLTLEKNGDFNIFGTYVISKGSYEFNIENIIRKDFVIQDGSTIEWFGQPENATVNINAVYILNNVALEDLIQDPSETRRTKVECVINISGKLLNPEFKLDIILPETLNEYTVKLNNLAENEMNEQFLSLLLLGNFQALPGIRQDNIGGDQVTGEILAKQLNSLLRKIKYVDVNVDYESGNTRYSDEYKIGVSKSFLGDRIEVKGNLGIGGRETENTDANNYIGEFELEAKLNKKGTVRAKVYNKANDRIENDGDYIQGVGFIWQRDFDKLFRFKKKTVKDSAKPPLEQNDTTKNK